MASGNQRADGIIKHGEESIQFAVAHNPNLQVKLLQTSPTGEVAKTLELRIALSCATACSNQRDECMMENTVKNKFSLRLNTTPICKSNFSKHLQLEKLRKRLSCASHIAALWLVGINAPKGS